MSTILSPAPLPVLHRLAILYLMVPVLLFLVTWFQPWFGLPAAGLLALALAPALGGSWHTSFSLGTVSLCLMALVWVMLTGAGGFLDTNTNADWVKNDSILLDMSRGEWPTRLPTPNDRAEPMLRYYLGYYMVPGLIGKQFGAGALNWAVPLWTWLGVSLLLCLFTRGQKGWGIAVAAVLLILFSGMDIIRVLMFQDLADIGLGKTHLEWDYDAGLQVQYSSNMTGLMYVPQHFLPAGLLVLLLLQCGDQQRWIRSSGILFAASLFWSPFVALGLLPLLIVFLYQRGIRAFMNWPNLLLAAPLALVMITYLMSGSSNFPGGWLWEKHDWSDLLLWVPAFYLNQFLLLALLLCLLNPRLRRNLWLGVAVLSLLLLPWYQYGYFNDLAMRASLPALFLLCYLCSQVLGEALPPHRQVTSNAAIAGLVVVLCAGSITAVFEVARAWHYDDGQRRDYGELEYTTLSTVHRFFRGQYIARNVPDWYRKLLRDSTPPPAQPIQEPTQ